MVRRREEVERVAGRVSSQSASPAQRQSGAERWRRRGAPARQARSQGDSPGRWRFRRASESGRADLPALPRTGCVFCARWAIGLRDGGRASGASALSVDGEPLLPANVRGL